MSIINPFLLSLFLEIGTPSPSFSTTRGSGDGVPLGPRDSSRLGVQRPCVTEDDDLVSGRWWGGGIRLFIIHFSLSYYEDPLSVLLLYLSLGDTPFTFPF